MELRRKEHHSEQQCADTNPIEFGEHLCTKTELRPDWLRGQVRDWRDKPF